MRGGPQRRCWPLIYVGFLCITLTVYAIFNAIYSSLLSANEEGSIAVSPHVLFSRQRHCRAGPLLPAGEKTLVVPPIFDHHAVALGSCPKFRVHEPHEMRASAWAHISELIREGRYLAISDVLDLSSVVPLVKLVDLRIFLLLWCGVNVSSACSGSLCRSLAADTSTWGGSLESCGALISRPGASHESCVYGVDEDCRTTIWVHKKEILDSDLKEEAASILKPEVSNKLKGKYGRRKFKEIVETLGNVSQASKYQVLSFGSLFSSEYKGSQLHVDIESSKDPIIRSLVEAMKYIPFTPAIVNAGKLYARNIVRKPFFCAQLRLLDGQFKNRWEKTFTSLKSQLKLAWGQQGELRVLNVFVMTDLPRSNWSKTYLGELDADKSYKLHTLDASNPLIQETASKLAEEDYGLLSGYLPPHKATQTELQYPKRLWIHPDILLFVEEVICSCASLGFVGTSGSTLSANILQLRLGNTCKSNVQ
ncbi:hypothetical protein GOP47_0016585 [Adiantum capillus-veneris]|uniref:O-fucosyltransferase family protein n=1 Tax=Adiantum capillus-veneris TaxID=13818 RepID=A0A9D4UHZ4_ADICA|nr:hypothetical protein GOP47_0016585 [Adiantum capillus-veneris]